MRALATIALLLTFTQAKAAESAMSEEEEKYLSETRQLNDSGRITESENMAIECAKKTSNGWCQYYAGRSLLGKSGKIDATDYGLSLIKEASSKSIPSADFAMGSLYANGYISPPNDGEAFRLIERAANNCQVAAQYELGKKYLEGKLVPKSKGLAFYWLSISAYYKHPQGKSSSTAVAATLNDQEFEYYFSKAQSFPLTRKCGLSADRRLSLDFITPPPIPNKPPKLTP